MAKVSVLMPHPELKELAISLIAQYSRIEPVAIEYVQTDRISDRAAVLEREGSDLIIARGLQARIARDSVRIPIIEMRASTQELASQVLEMKHILMSTPFWWIAPSATGVPASSAASRWGSGPGSWA